MRPVSTREGEGLSPLLCRLPEEAQERPYDDVDVEHEPGAEDHDRQLARPQLLGKILVEDDLPDDRGEDGNDQADE